MDYPASQPLLGAALDEAYLSPWSSSFTEFLSARAPELLPRRRIGEGAVQVPHGTTIVAITFRGGVLLAGDRRATSGNVIAQRDIEKVYVTDEYSAVGVAGSAGLAVEMVRLYAVELQHYEKINGVPLSLDGKTNQLATMVRSHLDMAMAGLAVLPLFVGYDTGADDPDRGGRIVTFDVAGGRFEEHAGYHAVGSGSVFAKSALKKLYDPDAEMNAAIRTAIEALYDAADDDSATGGPDLARRIFPNVITVTAAEGAVKLPEERTAEVAEAVVEARRAAGGE